MIDLPKNIASPHLDKKRGNDGEDVVGRTWNIGERIWGALLDAAAQSYQAMHKLHVSATVGPQL